MHLYRLFLFQILTQNPQILICHFWFQRKCYFCFQSKFFKVSAFENEYLFSYEKKITIFYTSSRRPSGFVTAQNGRQSRGIAQYL